MKTLVLCMIVLTCCGVLAACDNTTGNTTDLRTQAFDKEQVILTADVERAVSDKSITLTTSCLPLVSGKGRIGIRGRGLSQNTSWFLESPFRDTLETEANPDSAVYDYVLVEYVANRTFSQPWQIRLQSGISYSFAANVILDSIYIADSARMYHICSDVAIRYSPGGHGYNREGQSGSHLILEP
jgi:hypothetical protein